MSSYISAAEIERRRLEQLKIEIDNNISKLKNQIKEKYENRVEEKNVDNIVSVGLKDDSKSGYAKKDTIETIISDIVEKDEGIVPSQRKREVDMDLSLLLVEDSMEEIAVEESSSLEEHENVREEMVEYEALLELLDMEERDETPLDIEKENQKLRSQLEKRCEDQFIVDTINEAMVEMGFKLSESTVLDSMEGTLYSDENNPLCDVFMGLDGHSVLFEPVVETRKASRDRLIRIEESAGKVCAMYDELEMRVAKKGVILKRVYASSPNAQAAYARSDIKSLKKKDRKQKKRELKQMQREVK